MAAIPGSVRVAGFLAPTDSTDTYAVTHDTYNKGGYRTVATVSERDAITNERRSIGMMVYVTGDQTAYVLGGTDVSDNTAWVAFSPGITPAGDAGEIQYNAGGDTLGAYDAASARTYLGLEIADTATSLGRVLLVDSDANVAPMAGDPLAMSAEGTIIAGTALSPGGSTGHIQYNDGNGGFGGHTAAQTRTYLGLEIAGALSGNSTALTDKVLRTTGNFASGDFLKINSSGKIVSGTVGLTTPAGSNGEVQFNLNGSFSAYNREQLRNYAQIHFIDPENVPNLSHENGLGAGINYKVLKTEGTFRQMDPLIINANGNIAAHPRYGMDPGHFVNASVYVDNLGRVHTAKSNSHDVKRISCGVENYSGPGGAPNPGSGVRLMEHFRPGVSSMAYYNDRNPFHSVYSITTDYFLGQHATDLNRYLYGVYYPHPHNFDVGTTFTICYATALAANFGPNVSAYNLEQGSNSSASAVGANDPDLPDISQAYLYNNEVNIGHPLHVYQQAHRLVLRPDTDQPVSMIHPPGGSGAAPVWGGLYNGSRYINGDETYREVRNNTNYPAFYITPGGSVTLCCVEGRHRAGSSPDTMAKFWQIIAHYDRDPFVNLPYVYGNYAN